MTTCAHTVAPYSSINWLIFFGSIPSSNQARMIFSKSGLTASDNSSDNTSMSYWLSYFCRRPLRTGSSETGSRWMICRIRSLYFVLKM